MVAMQVEQLQSGMWLVEPSAASSAGSRNSASASARAPWSPMLLRASKVEIVWHALTAERLLQAVVLECALQV